MKNKKVWGIILLFTLIFFILSQTNFQVYAASDSNTIDVSNSDSGQTLPEGVSYSGNVFTITSGGIITVIGTTETNTIAVETGVTNLTLTLSGTSIKSLSKSPIDIQGNSNVNIVLANGTTNSLDAYQKAGLSVPSGATVYINGTGTMNAKVYGLAAGIGGGYQESCGTVNISGGTINTTGGGAAAGIGGGSYGGSGGTITISGGTVTATGGYAAAGIGGGGYAAIGGGSVGNGGTITISGGTVNATGGDTAAGIGGGNGGSGGTITISGGTVTAKGGNTGGAGIGGGSAGSGGAITISGGTVTATGGTGNAGGAGIGGGGNEVNLVGGSSGTINISAGTVTATGGIYAAGIGSGNKGNSETIIISAGTVNATGGYAAAGIGGGNLGTGGKITIKNTTVTAIGGTIGAGIGSGRGDSTKKELGLGGEIEIDNATVKATAGLLAAGIGGGHYSSGFNITIKNSNIEATGASGAGIGSGDSGASSTITISGSIIKATSGDYGAGIGGGYLGAGCTIIISGSEINATGNHGAGIGGGVDSTSSSTITIIGSTINATGKVYGAGIGGGNRGNGGTITINESTVNANGSQGAGIGGGYNGAGGTITISGSAVNAKGAFGAGIGGGYSGSGGIIIIDDSSTVTAISNGYAKYAIDAVSGSSGSIINAQLDGAISTTTSSYIKLATNSLILPAEYKNFAFSATTDSIIKAYSDSEFKSVLGSIVTNDIYEKTLIPVTDLSQSPTNVTKVKKVAEIVEQDPNSSVTTINVGDGQTLPTGVSYASNVFTISTGGSITVIGTTTTNTIEVATGVTNLTLTLSGTSITSSTNSIKSPISILGNSNVNIVLASGTTNTLNASNTSGKAGLSVPSSADVNISGTGTLNAKGHDYHGAGIGGGDGVSGGTITISSGTVNATGGSNGGAGIGGGGNGVSGGTTTINGGTINATGGASAAGIGGGSAGNGGIITISGGLVNSKGSIGGGNGFSGSGGSGGTITISGGIVNATGDTSSAGIGGGYKGSGGTITISGGEVTAIGGNTGGAGIGGGSEGGGGTIIISGGIVNSTGNNQAAGIGGGTWGSGGTITISGGEVTAACGNIGGAGIGGGARGTGGTITINNLNTKVTATGGTNSAGIGGGSDLYASADMGLGGDIKIYNGIVKATGGSNAAGIGGGNSSAGGKITINNGSIEAIGGSGGAGIGGGSGGAGGIIIINGGNIKAFGNDAPQSGISGGAGIGGGSGGAGGTITISSSAINATGSMGACIGGGSRGAGGTITISGSAVNAIGTYGAGIGGGYGGTGGTITINNSSTVTAISRNEKPAIDAITGSSGYIINAQLDAAISTTTSSYIKLASASLALPAYYKNFAISATTDSTIKAYSDEEFNTLIGNIVTKVDDKTLIPVTNLSVSHTSITQLKIATANEEQNPKNSDATLSNLTINGTTINNFPSGTLTYNIELAAGTSIVPTVVATVTDTGKASAVLTKATSLPGTTTVLVTAEDGTTTKTYTINFTVASENNPAPSESSSDDSSSNYYELKVDILVNGKNETSAQITTTRVNDKTVTKITLDDKKVEEKLKGESRNTVITIPVNSKTDVAIGTLNGQTVKNMENKEAVLEVKNDNVTYTLPASQINIDSVSEKIGKQVELKDIEVNVKISEPTAEILKKVEDTINKNNYSMVVKPIEFEITCSSGNQTVEVSRFNSYVERIIEIPKGIDPSKITTGIVINEDGTFSHIPTNVYIQDNKYYAKLNSLTNSTYSVIWNPINVASVENHWSKEAVNDMASRLVVKNPETFSPDYNITRGEFADYITKALGIYRTNTIITKKYSDISSENEIAIAVTIATEYGIIKGYPDNTFRPDALITREEAMTMYARAMGIVKLNVEDENRIQSFQDKELISSWAYESVKSAVGAKVFNGKTLITLDPQGTFTSAESATAIRNLLIKAKLINE